MSSRVIQDMLKDALGRHRAGQLREAEEIYQNILAMDPRHADSLHLLGMIASDNGRHEAAVRMIRRAIEISPKNASYHCNLGTILRANGELEEAAACYEVALALKPDLAEIQSNFGNILEAQGKLEQAAGAQERALALKPEFAEAWSNLGNVRQAQRRLDEAVACYERALALKPGYADAHNNLGTTLVAQDRIDDAVAHYERALILRPNFAHAHNNLGTAFVMQGKLNDAKAHYERALVLKPDYANTYNNLGNVSKAQGNFEDAMAHYGRAITLRPDYAEAHFSRAEVKSFQPGDADLAALEALASRDDLPGDKAMYIHFGLAKALEDSQEFTRAFEHFRIGNGLKRQLLNYDEAREFELFERLAAVFNPQLFDRFKGAGDPSQVPVFVLGMPRSGSTLLEQILASHPQIQGGGELTALEKMTDRNVLNVGGRAIPYPECIPTLDSATLLQLGQSYLARLPALEEGKTRMVDKLTGNFLRIGLIRLILPNAKIIHSMRNPIDTCVSCYSKLFASGLPFTYDLGELGRYYRHYSELMAHWRSVLPPDALLDVTYEDVVEDLEGQAKRLIDYCGLAWDDRCIRFHQTSRPVNTASAVQVRQPLFRSSVQRWRKYEDGLAPLLDELGH